MIESLSSVASSIKNPEQMGILAWTVWRVCRWVHTQEVDLSWISSSSSTGLPLPIVQAMDGLPDAAISSFSRAVYRPNVCVPQFQDIQLHDVG